MTTTDEFDTFARDDRINRARWLSGLMFETSTDRLKAFVEVLGLLEDRPAAPVALPDHWTTVEDRDGDVWDRLPGGRWRDRLSGAIWTTDHLAAAGSPLRPIVLTDAA